MKHLIKFFFIIFFISSCSHENEGVITEKGMVVSAREEASKIGVEILKKGGNAFDAMMATELALAVSYPSAGNIGGGGFMVFRLRLHGTLGHLYPTFPKLPQCPQVCAQRQGSGFSSLVLTSELRHACG